MQRILMLCLAGALALAATSDDKGSDGSGKMAVKSQQLKP